jgi:hypothetical protein
MWSSCTRWQNYWGIESSSGDPRPFSWARSGHCELRTAMSSPREIYCGRSKLPVQIPPIDASHAGLRLAPESLTLLRKQGLPMVRRCHGRSCADQKKELLTVKTTGRSVNDKTPSCCRPRSLAINAGSVYAAAVSRLPGRRPGWLMELTSRESARSEKPVAASTSCAPLAGARLWASCLLRTARPSQF